jgi:hypothetical protein
MDVPEGFDETHTAYGWRLFLFMPVCTEWTMSGRMGLCS